MSKDRRSRVWIIAVVVVAIVICLIIAALLYSFQRTRSFNSRPLVMIHNPLNRDEIEVGDGVIIHATGRSQRGIAHIELWVDDEKIAERDVNGQSASPLTLTKSWFPKSVGTHLITVRARTRDDVEGQSSIGVIAVDNGELGGAVHTVQEGETLATIAEDFGTTPEEIEEINPEMSPGGPAPGDSLEIPDDEPRDADGVSDEAIPPTEDEATDDEEPPGPAPESPSDESVIEEVSDWFGHPEEGSVGLQIEVLELATLSGNPESLHCYVSFAGAPPIWYPDTDNDQSTDESFEQVGIGPDGEEIWNAEEYLSGAGSTPVIFIPESGALDFRIECVGVGGGGTEALDMGSFRSRVLSEHWNGTEMSRGVIGDDGSYRFTYRVIPVGDHPRGVPMYLDPDMASPTNVRIDERRVSLLWDYEPEADPEEDREPIDGFRIYLNGNLQWVEMADARESGLPYEWLNPPCGTTYTFGVTAFRFGYPDGPESFPGVTMVSTPAEDCNREVQINFLTLETFNLGGDGRYEDRDGDVGPPYGSFFANDRSFSFDTRSPVILWGEAGLDVARGLSHNTVYNMPEMAADPTWGFTGGPSLIVDVPEGETFEFGFDIMDNDTGPCNRVLTRGCDDHICDGLSALYESNSSLDYFQEGALESENGRCRVSFSFGPAFGSPVGTGAEGEEPLPFIDIEDIFIDEATGLMQIQVRNTGRATWPWRDLDIQLQSRSGTTLSTVTFPGYVLETGQRDVLEDPGLVLEAPFDGCVLIDPNDQVLEEYERSGARFHHPVCPQLPDLEIRDANYAPEGGGVIRLTVRNSGDGAIERRRVVFHTFLADGTPLDVGASYPHTNMEPGEERFFEIRNVSESVRAQMAQGYTVVVNPDVLIAETNIDNNSFEVPGSQRLWVYWHKIEAPESISHVVEFDLDVYATSGSASRHIADWHIGQDIDWGSCFDDEHCIRIFYDGEYDTDWFEIYGDENLEIVTNITHPGSLTESMDALTVYGPIDNWGSHPASNFSCYPDYDGHEDLYTLQLGRVAGNSWEIGFNLCRDDSE